MLALGCDHGGFVLKQIIAEHLDQIKVAYKDFGVYTDETSVNYPKYACLVAKAVQHKECQFGILCCGTGIGMSIAANKVSGIRAAVCYDEFTAEMARRHNNANVLCLGGRVLNPAVAVRIVDIFIDMPFDGGRHVERIEQISRIENDNMEL